MKRGILSGIWLPFTMCLATSVFAGDATSQSENENIKEELTMELVYEKFEQNGPQLLCNQQSYLDCYKISAKKCEADIKSVNEKCIKYSRKKTDSISNLKKRRKKFGKIYTTCIGMRHATMYSELSGQLEFCLEDMKFDKAKAKKTILQ